MPNRSNLVVPLAMSMDQRATLAAASLSSGLDQRRLNAIYEIVRPSVGVPPEVILVRRPGCTDQGGTFGAGTQVPYLVAMDPASTQDPTPVLIVKDGTINKAVTSSASYTILDNTNFVPRFWDIVNISGVPNLVVQLQNTATPNAAGNLRTFYSTNVSTWAEITDVDYTGLIQVGKMEFMDGFAFQMDSRGRIYQSTVNTLANWETNDFDTRTIQQDYPQGLLKTRNQLLGFGINTVEVYTNQGDLEGAVIGRIPYLAQQVGLSAIAGGDIGIAGKTHYYTNIGDMAFFVGRFGGGAKTANLIAWDGSKFVKVSSPQEDKVLSSAPLYSVNRVDILGHIAVGIQLTAPTASTQRGLLFFPELKDWFEWESPRFSLVNNGRYFAGAGSVQKVFHFPASNNWQDDGASFDMVTQFRIPVNDQSWRVMSSFGVVADSPTTTQNLLVQFSDNDGDSFSTGRNIDLSKERKYILNCGGFRERWVRLTHSGDGEVRLRRAYMSVSG